MATYPLVTAQDDVAPLLQLSLAGHSIPYTAIFDVFELATEERFFAVATPLAKEKGLREAYVRIFKALGAETFAVQSFLRLHTLIISHEDLLAVRRVLKKGSSEASLPKLAHLGEVIVRRTEDPSRIFKSGMLHISRLGNGIFHIMFAPMDGRYLAKGRNFESMDRVKECLEALKIESPGELNELGHSRSVSIMVAAPLEAFYKQGLI